MTTLVLPLLLGTLLSAQTFHVTTVAGTDPVGDGRAAGEAILENAIGLAIAPDGALYLADSNAGRIRKVTPDRSQQFLERMYFGGRIETVAGAGGAYYNGDGIAGTEAYLAFPAALAVDATGNLYIADSANNRIRRVTLDGVIQTVAGGTDTGVRQPIGVAATADGVVYFCEPASGRVRRVGEDGSLITIAGGGQLGLDADGGPATFARLLAPTGIAIAADGSVLIAESGRHAIRKVSPDGFISTIAGSGAPGFSGDGGPAADARLAAPRAVAVHKNGEIFIADSGNLRVRRISSGGVIQTLVQPAAPAALAVDEDGNVFLAFGNQVNVWRPGQMGIGAPIVGGSRRGRDGVATESLVFAPASVASGRRGEIYIAEPSQDRIRVVEGGLIRTFAGTGPGFSGDGGPAAAASFRSPSGLTVDSQGLLWITDTINNRVRKVDEAGIIRTVAGSDVQLRNPRRIAVDVAGNLFIADADSLRKAAADGTISTLPLPVMQITGLATDREGNLYVADPGNSRLHRLSPSGDVATVQLAVRPRSLAVDEDGVVYFTADNSIYRSNAEGSVERIAGGAGPGFSGDGGPAAEARFNTPDQLWLDGGSLYVVDAGNHRIRLLTRVGLARGQSLLERNHQ